MINFKNYIKDKKNEDEDYLHDTAVDYIDDLSRSEIIELIEFYINNINK